MLPWPLQPQKPELQSNNAYFFSSVPDCPLPDIYRAFLSHFCRTCKRYHKQDARASESSAYNGESQTHPSRERGHNKPFTPCPAGNMGLTPTPCGHSRKYPAQTKRRNFPEQIKRQSTSPAQSPLWTVFLYAWFFSLIRSKVLSRLFAAAASAD